MHPEIANRFERLELRRKALVEKVRALPPGTQIARPHHSEFSPVEILMHMALAEKVDLDQIKAGSPSLLEGKSTKSTFLYRQTLKRMQSAKYSGTLSEMVPKRGITFDIAAESWEIVRCELAKCFEKVTDPKAAIVQRKFMGYLSTDQLLTLFEAHTHYHETRFPKVS